MIIKTAWMEKFLPLIQMIRDNGGEARFVGGCVRDALLERNVHDFDLATTFEPTILMDVLDKNCVKFVPTGLKHGTVTAIINGIPLEITTLRKDVKCDGRHAEVTFTDNWLEDAKRRDFTFNALYLDIEGSVYDYFDGIEDLNRGKLNFIGDPEERIQEDYLRILRAFRFHANICKLPIDENILLACAKFKDKIDSLSGERIQCEILKLLTYENSIDELKAMQDYGIIQKVFNAEFNFSRFGVAKIISCGLTKLALLVRNAKNSGVLNWINKRWKLPKKSYLFLNTLVNTKFEGDIKRIIVDFGRDIAKSVLQISYVEGEIQIQQFCDLVDFANSWEIPKFPIFGRDIKKLGYEGEEIGRTLKILRKAWEKSSYTLTKEELELLISENL